MLKLLEKLTNAPGISGHEKAVRDIILAEITPYVDEYEVDHMGNLITTKHGRGGPHIMLAAHMDEVGLIVRYIDEDGFLYFNAIGGWFDQTLLNQRMIVHTTNGERYGIIGSKPPHVMARADYDKVIKKEDMFIDVGASSREEAEKMGIRIGTQIVPDAKFCNLNGNIIAAKAFDNRAGCVMLINVMKNILHIDATIHAVFTVQKEVGLKGATTAAFKLNPDFAFATDVTICGDHPGISQKEANVSMGKGVVATVSDASGCGIIVPEIILDKIRSTAEEYNIPVQYEAGNGGTTDGSAIHLVREGIPTGVLSVPTRYIHTPYSVIDVTDLHASINLVSTMLGNW